MHKKNLSNQLSNSSTYFGLRIWQPISRQNPKLLIKKNIVHTPDILWKYACSIFEEYLKYTPF